VSNCSYDPQAVAAYFDRLGRQEWDRLTATPVDEVSLHVHAHYLRQYVPRGARVLEIGAGAGRFTQLLAEQGARVVVADISSVQLDLNRHHAEQYGYRHAVEAWEQVDACRMGCFADQAFDSVVAYGGLFSYVLERRDAALGECLRVLSRDGLLLASVMSLWGSAHRALEGVLVLPVEINQRITATGDLTARTWPARKDNYMHLFRAEELRTWLAGSGLAVLRLSASNCLSTGHAEMLREIRQDPAHWEELLRVEIEACAEPGCLDMGTHIIAVGQKTVSNKGISPRTRGISIQRDEVSFEENTKHFLTQT
jgi:ubiquinone/menaquinone biosynthesis C-methylase UbiE